MTNIEIKEIIKLALGKEENILFDAIKEYYIENELSLDNNNKQELIAALVLEDFKKYEDVFKALA